MIFSYKDERGTWHKKSESTGLKERGNKRAAEAMMKKRLEELRGLSATAIETRELLFLDAMEEWLTVVMPGQVRQNTLNEYKRAFAYHVKSYERFRGLLLQEVAPQILQKFYNDKVQGGLSPNTVHKLHANIGKFLKYAYQLDMIQSNPADRVTLPKKEKCRTARFYTAEQLRRLLSLFWGDPLEVPVYLAVHFGLRRSEVCGLRWDAVDFANRRIQVRHTAIVTDGETIYSDHTKSESSRRTLAMGDDVVDYLLRVRQVQADNRRLFGNMYEESGYVCTTADGKPIRPDFITHHFKLILEKTDLPYIRFHDLRHSFASLLHDSGYDLKDIQSWLGHSDIQTTGNIYTHLNTRRMDCMAQAVGEALTPKLKAV
ncbi:MAG: site-specific integrase [Oscillospiraceae bacterium]|nr:site-specific integrase [Oscillospiraceae bacterium]